MKSNQFSNVKNENKKPPYEYSYGGCIKNEGLTGGQTLQRVVLEEFQKDRARNENTYNREDKKQKWDKHFKGRF